MKIYSVLMNPRLLGKNIRRPGCHEKYNVTYVGSSFLVLRKIEGPNTYGDDFVLECGEARGCWVYDEDLENNIVKMEAI